MKPIGVVLRGQPAIRGDDRLPWGMAVELENAEQGCRIRLPTGEEGRAA
jgi:hypothetical protein